MPVHLMPGPLTGVGPPGKAAPISTGPPDMATLFAALLLQTGNPAPPDTAKPAENETEKKPTHTSSTRGTKRPDLLPGQDTPRLEGAAKIKLTTPLNTVVTAAKTQNAMDTFPASPTSKGERANRKPDGELPLSEARTPLSAGFSSLPAYLPTTPVPILLVLPAQNLPVSKLSLPVSNLSLPMSSVPGTPANRSVGVTAAISLPKTFAIAPKQTAGMIETAGVTAQNLPAEVQPLPQSSIRASQFGKPEAATPVVPRPEQIAYSMELPTAPVTGTPALSRLVSATSEASAKEQFSKEVMPVIQDAEGVVSASQAQIPSLKTADLPGVPPTAPEAGKTGASPMPPLPLSASPGEASAGIPAITLPVYHEQTLETGKVMPGATNIALPEKPLKTGAVPADTHTINNTRMQAVPSPQPLPSKPPRAVAAKQDEKASDGSGIAVIPTSPSAAPVLTGKPAALPPLSHAERAQVVQQAADGIGAVRPPSRLETPEQVTIQLHPKDWGKLQVSVTLVPQTHTESVPGQKAVTAHIVAESHQVKAALESQTGELRHALRATGMHLDRLTVSVQSASRAEPTAASGGGSQSQTNLGGNNGSGQSSGSAFASFAGNSQGGRQGHSPNFPGAFGAPEPEDIVEPLMPRQLMRGQIDTRA